MKERVEQLVTRSFDAPTLFHWNTILQYYDQHKDDLTDKEVQALYEASEHCREYLNKDKVVRVRLTTTFGYEEIETIKEGLGIKLEEIKSDLYRIV